MSETLVLDVANDRSELERIANEATALGEREDWTAAILFKITLALEELVLNVMTHGYHEGLQGITITLASDEESICIEIVDDGLPFDPLNDAPEPDLASSVGARHVGGLGVYLVLEMMNEVHYSRQSDKNCLTMRMLRHDAQA